MTDNSVYVDNVEWVIIETTIDGIRHTKEIMLADNDRLLLRWKHAVSRDDE